MKTPDRLLAGPHAEPCRTYRQVIDIAHKDNKNRAVEHSYPQFIKRLIFKAFAVERLAVMKSSVPDLAGPIAKSLISLCRTSFAEPAGPLAKCLISLCRTYAGPTVSPYRGRERPTDWGLSLGERKRRRRGGGA